MRFHIFVLILDNNHYFEVDCLRLQVIEYSKYRNHFTYRDFLIETQTSSETANSKHLLNSLKSSLYFQNQYVY